MRFKNKFDSSGAVTLFDILKWQFFKCRTWRQTRSCLEMKEDQLLLKSKEDFICWLGHASFLIQLNQKRFLFDPVFGNIPFYKRQFPAPYRPEELGNIDYVFISHTHFDHFDAASIKALRSKNVSYLVPLGMERYLHKIDKNIEVKTLEWYDSFELSSQLKISLVPAKHWGRRGLFDTNKALWGGVVLASNKSSLYFAGDTAYDDHFSTIGEAFSIDYALLPIGAYDPVEVMKHNHLNPQEAYEAFQDLKAKCMIPMHYGTFNLSDEPLNQPSQWLDMLVEEHKDEIYKIKVGEVLFL